MSLRIEPIGAVGSVDHVSPIYPITRSTVQRIKKPQPKRAKLYSALNSYSNGTHLKTYLDLLNRNYETEEGSGEFYLGRKHSKLFEADVVSVVSKRWKIISVQATLLRDFTHIEQEKMKDYLTELNISGRGEMFLFGYRTVNPNLLTVVMEISYSDINRIRHLNKYLDLPMKRFFKEEQGLYECLLQ